MAAQRRKKILAAAGVLILAAAGGAALLPRFQVRATQAQESYTQASVERRSITNALTGSGTLKPADAYTVTTLLSGEVLTDTFQEGDTVEKDALLYTIDTSGVTSSVSQAQTSYDQALKAKYPTADSAGIVKEVYVRNGESVSPGTALLKIAADDALSMDFQFPYVDPGSFYAGQSARIYITGFESYLEGTVTQVGGSSMANASGQMMTTVRVTADNPGLVVEGAAATASIGNYTSADSAAVKVGASTTVTAGVSGKVSGLTLMPGDSVSAGQRICTLTGESVDDQIETARTNLENARDRLEDYRITSPITGTVVEKTVKAGDNVGGGSGSSSLCIIYDLSYLQMTLNIDELDIDNVEVGQTVNITSDAREGQTFSGVVTKTSVVGSTSGGTTTYPVTVRIDETEGLRPGMNVDAEIVLTGAENVLAIPGSAVNRGNTVLITSDSPSAVNALEQEAPEGYVYVSVTTGVSDNSFVEIVSGLQEGDTVAYLRGSGSGGTDDFMMIGGMPGDMGGGMPSGMGGGPGGGRPGGGF